MNALELLVEQLADAVAHRVVELQRIEAERSRTRYLSPAEMAERTGLSEKTLANRRSRKLGPPFTKTGGRIRYPISADS